jgi:serine protease
MAAGMLAVVLVSLGKRMRPGYLNVLFNPRFLLPLILSTVGFFFSRFAADAFSGPASDVLDATAIPIPDLDRIIFGRGKLANPLFYSALIPVVASFFAVRWKGLRPVVGGLAIGFAGFLGYAMWAHAPALAWMPFKFLAMPWLAINCFICLFVARAMLQKETV